MPGSEPAGRARVGGGLTVTLDAGDSERAHAVALSRLPAMGPASLSRLVALHGAGGAWAAVRRGRPLGEEEPASPVQRRRWAIWAQASAKVDIEASWSEVRALGIGVEVLTTPGFPAVLAGDHQRPGVIFTRGSLEALEGPRVAVVGTRRASRYGTDVAFALGRDLATAGVRVVSGLAKGIDAAAHAGALRAGSAPAVGVVGSGLDVIYPRSSARVWEAVASTGLLLSEAPPGAAPEAWRFPVRNRVLAALGQVVVVVESGPSGGSRHTVDAALARDRPVLAVPGPVTSPTSVLPNRLLAEGAAPAIDAADVLVALGLSPSTPTATGGDGRAAVGAGPPDRVQARVLDAIGWSATCLEDVVSRSGLRPGAVAVALARLEADGWVVAGPGTWERTAGPRR